MSGATAAGAGLGGSMSNHGGAAGGVMAGGVAGGLGCFGLPGQCPIEGSFCSDILGCQPPCESSDDECPPGPASSATPKCENQRCLLRCETEDQCPTGMPCTNKVCGRA